MRSTYPALAQEVARLRQNPRSPGQWNGWKRTFCAALRALPPVGQTTRTPETLGSSVLLFSDPDTIQQQLLSLSQARDAPTA